MTRPVKPNPRPDIPEAEWQTLCEYLAEPVIRGKRERYYLRYYEARRLTWRDISYTRTLTGDQRLVFTIRGKTGEREVRCNIGVERWVAELEQYHRDESGRRFHRVKPCSSTRTANDLETSRTVSSRS